VNDDIEPDEPLSCAQIGVRFGVSPEWVRRKMDDGSLAATNLGSHRQPLIRPSEFVRFKAGWLAVHAARRAELDARGERNRAQAGRAW
jgi:hypothetical protein